METGVFLLIHSDYSKSMNNKCEYYFVTGKTKQSKNTIDTKLHENKDLLEIFILKCR